jgi:two-component system response regulator RegA
MWWLEHLDMQDSRSLLIVEDDDVLRERLGRAFTRRGLEVREARTAADAEASARADPPELALVDLRIGNDSGLRLIPALRALDPGTRIVVLTGYGSVATAVQALRLGAVHYLTKPADADEILAAFDQTPSDGAEPDLIPMSLDQVEWEHINRVLLECGGNVSEAARLLRVHRRTLQRKLAKFPSR